METTTQTLKLYEEDSQSELAELPSFVSGYVFAQGYASMHAEKLCFIHYMVTKTLLINIYIELKWKQI